MKEKKYHIFTINIPTVHIISTVILLITGFITLIIALTLKLNIYTNYNMFTIIIGFLIYMIIHEILHSIGYLIYGGKWKNIIYGIELNKGVFYCLCKQNITRKNLLNSIMLPFFYIGILTYIIALIFDINILLWLSILNISGCSVDLIMFNYIRKLKNIEYTEFDDPISFALYTQEDLSKTKHFGLIYKGTQKEIKRENLKKVQINKQSYIILLIILIIGVIYILK